MSLFQMAFDYAAPVLYVDMNELPIDLYSPVLTKLVYSLITSPITSYADQIFSIHRTRSSAGFSLDIPLIMLVSSILKYDFDN